MRIRPANTLADTLTIYIVSGTRKIRSWPPCCASGRRCCGRMFCLTPSDLCLDSVLCRFAGRGSENSASSVLGGVFCCVGCGCCRDVLLRQFSAAFLAVSLSFQRPPFNFGALCHGWSLVTKLSSMPSSAMPGFRLR